MALDALQGRSVHSCCLSLHSVLTHTHPGVKHDQPVCRIANTVLAHPFRHFCLQSIPLQDVLLLVGLAKLDTQLKAATKHTHFNVWVQ